MTKKNIQTSGKMFDTVPKERVIKIIEKAKENDAIIVIASRGVIDKDFARTPGQRVESIIVKMNPDVAATSIFNHAVKFNEADEMLKFCQMLRNIADCAETNIRTEIKNQSINN